MTPSKSNDLSAVPLPLVRLCFRLSARGRWRLPEFAGDHLKRRLETALRNLDHRDHRLSGEGQVWAYLLRSQNLPGERAAAAGKQAPNPLTMRPQLDGPTSFKAGDCFEFDAMLIGHAAELWRPLIEGVAWMAERGLGQGRECAPLDLLDVTQRGCAEPWIESLLGRDGPSLQRPEPEIMAPPPVPDAVTVRLLTPVIIRSLDAEGQRRVCRPEHLSFDLWLNSLLRRVRDLAHLHAGQMVELGLPEQPERLMRASRLLWQPGLRPPTSKQGAQPFGGVIGWMRLAGPELRQVWPALWLGQWLALGNGCTMGFGRYRLERSWISEG